MYSSETPESKGSSFRGFTLPKISFDLAAVEKKGKDRRRNTNLITLHQLDSDNEEDDKQSISNKSENDKNKFINFDFLGPADHLLPGKDARENLSVVEEECLTSKQSNNNSPAYLGLNVIK